MDHTLSSFPIGVQLQHESLLQPEAKVPPARRVGSATRCDEYIARLAVDDSVRDDAFRLRYCSYVAGNHIEPNTSCRFKDIYDDMPNASTIVIYDRGVAVASVRTCTLARGTDLTSPARDAFRIEVDDLLDRDAGSPFSGRGIEVTRLVRSPEAENNQGLVFLLYRMAGYIALCAHSQVHLACIRENHTPFYRRLGYEAASELRPYPGLSCPMRLMASDRERYDRVRLAVPAMDPLGGRTGDLSAFFEGGPVTLSVRGA
jgi:ribosomal protein L34E